MNKIKLLITSIGILSNGVFANPAGEPATSNPWSITGSLGYAQYSEAYKEDGNAIIGRFAIGKQIYLGNHFTLGLELGTQSGNDMRLDISQENIDILGCLPIQSTVKPLLDLLATIKTQPFAGSAYAQVKGGIAYRRWQFADRDSINDLSQINGEIQAGIGFPVSSAVDINLTYQGIFGGSSHFQANSINETGHVNNIPIQNGVLLGFTYTA